MATTIKETKAKKRSSGIGASATQKILAFASLVAMLIIFSIASPIFSRLTI